METIYKTINKKIITYNNIQEIMNNNPTEEEINNAMSILVKKGIETGAIKINLEWLYPNKINNTRYLKYVDIDDIDIKEDDDDYVILTDEEVKKYFG